MSDETLAAIPMFALLAEASAALLALARKDLHSIALVNALAAAGLVLILVPELGVSVRYVDPLLALQVVLLAFALTTLTTSLCWFAFRQGQPWLVLTEFSILAALSTTVAIIVVVLRIARLI